MSILKLFQPIASAFAPNYTFWDVLIAWRYVFLPWKWGKLQEETPQPLPTGQAGPLSRGLIEKNHLLRGQAKTPQPLPTGQAGPLSNGQTIGETNLSRGQKNSRKLERKFCEYMDARWAVSFDSGRSGLYAILKCMGIKDYDEIILQAFTTVALPNIIQWCGAKPVFIDIDEKTYDINPEKIEEKITARTKAIIVQHTFGNPANMDRILEIAKKHNLFIIEDCAHSLGAEYENKKTGTFGDAAFFSFGRDKVISSVSGGMVITNNQELVEKIKEFRDEMPYPEKSLIIKQLLHPIVTFKALHLYYFFNLGKIIMFAASRLGIITKAYTKEEKKGERPKNFPAKMPNALAEIALHQMKLIEKFNDHRIEIANLYNKKLSGAKNISLPKSNPKSKNIFLWFTVLVPNKKELIKKARKNHIILGDWFPQPVGPIEVNLEKAGYELGSCPVAEKASSMCVNLPTHYRVDERDAERVAELFEN